MAVEPDEGEAVSDFETQVFRDRSRSILSSNQSPDVPFEISLNPYRGCEHGCSYCYARPTHEYLGLSAGLDFETRLIAKPDAPELLRETLSAPGYQPRVLALSGVTDAYQPIERRLRITRGCLVVLEDTRHPVSLITKSQLVLRDIDLLQSLASVGAAQVQVSLTSLDPQLSRVMEPRAAQPSARLRTLAELARAGVPVGVSLAPIIPGLNDHEIPKLLEAAANAGARWASFLMLRLPQGVGPLFEDWLSRHFPERKQKVLSLIRSMRDGRLNDSRFGRRMRGAGPHFEMLRELFEASRRRFGLDPRSSSLRTDAFAPPRRGQLPLF